MMRERQFNHLCDELSDDIFRFALSLLGNRADAEDATQDVLLKLWRNMPLVLFRNPRAWVFRTTRNCCIDHLRRRAVRNTPGDLPAGSTEGLPDESFPHPSTKADSQFLHEQVDKALQQLPENLRSVFVLYEVNGLRYREISGTMGIPLNSVKAYLFRAREQLKAILTKETTWISNYIN